MKKAGTPGWVVNPERVRSQPGTGHAMTHVPVVHTTESIDRKSTKGSDQD
jgi:hypothetical protein